MLNEASFFDRFNMTKNGLKYDRKKFTPTNVNVWTWPKKYKLNKFIKTTNLNKWIWPKNIWMHLLNYYWVVMHVLFCSANACSYECWLQLWTLNVYILQISSAKFTPHQIITCSKIPWDEISSDYGGVAGLNDHSISCGAFGRLWLFWPLHQDCYLLKKYKICLVWQ